MHGRSTHQKRIIKIFTVIILAVFLFTMAVTFVMYLGGPQPTRDQETIDTMSGDTMTTGTVQETGMIYTGE